MSGALRKVATVAGVVALAATGVGAFAAAGTALAATAATAASVATVVATAASVGAQLTAKEPPRLGSVTDTLLAVNPPQPYLLGRTYFGGVIRHEIGYGPTTNDVVNPLYFRAAVFGGGGPYEALESVQVDYQPVAFSNLVAQGYYNNYLYADTQLGQCPEPFALGQAFTNAIPGWGPSARLSGQAAIGFAAAFDKKGKRFASGLPALGGVWLGAKCYDMRLDGTLPNGAGDHRQFQEATYEFSKNPAVQPVTYAMGRVQNGKLVLGVGIGFQDVVVDGIGPVDGIWWDDWAAFANVCDANGWEGGGVVFEGEGAPPRWDNLKDICAAGGGIPVVTGGRLGVVWQAPRVAVDTISAADLTDAPVRKPSSKSIAERVNAITPKFASEAHQWDFVPGEEIVIDDYVAADGGEKRSAGETQINLCNQAKQAAELCTYKLARLRERGPIEIPCGPRMRRYRIGTCLVCAEDMADYNLAGQKVVVLDRTIDLQTMTVKLLVETESDAKHAMALGQAGAAPPVVATSSSQERDAVAVGANSPVSAARQIVTSTIAYPVTTTDTTATIVEFDATLDNGDAISFPAASITGLTEATSYVVLWSLDTGTYSAMVRPALAELANPRQVIVRYISTQNANGTYPETTPPPGGDGGGGYGGGPQVVNSN
ncbi:hypothetical protein [Qipengyuania sp.]|uniref:hypothetical protein n=1 Tax=Qipengyuania sp. TaxID=2004515 RepID=UPI0035C8441B